MWQLRKLSTNEPLNEAGDLPKNWHSIFGLHGFIDKIGDLSWLGADYKDMGWIELSAEEEKQVNVSKSLNRINKEKNKALLVMEKEGLTVNDLFLWQDYVLALDEARLQPDIDTNLKMPICPNTE